LKGEDSAKEAQQIIFGFEYRFLDRDRIEFSVRSR
jgi:hypothetical protein